MAGPGRQLPLLGAAGSPGALPWPLQDGPPVGEAWRPSPRPGGILPCWVSQDPGLLCPPVAAACSQRHLCLPAYLEFVLPSLHPGLLRVKAISSSASTGWLASAPCLEELSSPYLHCVQPSCQLLDRFKFPSPEKPSQVPQPQGLLHSLHALLWQACGCYILI